MQRLNLCRRAAESAMASMRRALLLLLVATATALAASSAWGQLVDDPTLPVQERRDITLQWLDRYLTESQLLRREDMDKIRAAVEQMSSSQLEQWLEQTKDLRAYVESEKWQETKVWLREFLRVLPKSSDAGDCPVESGTGQRRRAHHSGDSEAHSGQACLARVDARGHRKEPPTRPPDTRREQGG